MTALYAHALRLHREHPDTPLPNDGKPYPARRALHLNPAPKSDLRRSGARAAAVLDRYFGQPSASPADLAALCEYAGVPGHPNEHITAAALRADRDRVQAIGRWLVRHGTHTSAVAMGMALLAAGWDEEDIPLIQTIGLLSDTFGSLAAAALTRRTHGADALRWLAQRVDNWGKVYIVNALCQEGGLRHRDWLLRHSCTGQLLECYFAGHVATAADLHEAIVRPDPDAALVDHTGRLLLVMSAAEGMGLSLERYPPADIVLAAHAERVSELPPTAARYTSVTQLADALSDGHWPEPLRRYRALLARPDWAAVSSPG